MLTIYKRVMYRVRIALVSVFGIYSKYFRALQVQAA